MTRRQPEEALYVRLPTAAADRLHRASEALKVPKKELIAGLVARYVDPDTRKGREALATLAEPRRVASGAEGPTLGSYSFQPYDPPELPEVLTIEQAAQLLQLEPAAVLALAEAGDLPGRKLGSAWRFSRAAIVAWLAG